MKKTSREIVGETQGKLTQKTEERDRKHTEEGKKMTMNRRWNRIGKGTPRPDPRPTAFLGKGRNNVNAKIAARESKKLVDKRHGGHEKKKSMKGGRG